MHATHELKRDALGTVSLGFEHGRGVVTRDTTAARRGAGWLARRLAKREAAALRAIGEAPGLPRFIDFDGRLLRRSYLPGEPMHAARPASKEFFADALKLARRLHRLGVVHNDLGKEANWICMPGDRAAIVDFQLACVFERRGRLFRGLAREDLRHLLKHKRTYLRDALTRRERAIIATPSTAARVWRTLFKPPYLFITRRLLGWRERGGPEERLR